VIALGTTSCWSCAQAVAIREIADFADCGVDLINPWEP
jgi:hypothetical protein